MNGDHQGRVDPWWYGTWEGSREARLDAALAATPAQRLAWLEDALKLVFHVTSQDRPDSDPASELEGCKS